MNSIRAKFGARAAPVALALGLMASAAASAHAEQAAAPADHTTSVSDSFIQWNPVVPVAPLAGGAVLFFALGAFAWWRHEKTAMPTTLAALLGAGMLANPQLITRHFEPVPDDVILVVDRTASQALPGRAEMTQEAERSLTQTLQAMPNVNTRVVTVDPPSDSAEDQGTRLFAAIDTLSGTDWNNVAGVIALTDGQVVDVPEKPPFSQGVPFYALISGHEGETDRLAQFIKAPAYGLVGEDQTVEFKILDTGTPDQTPQTVNVHITGNGGAPQTMQVKTGETVRARLRIQNPGPNIFNFEADPLPGESTRANNGFVSTIEGTRESFNILIISGRATPGVETLRKIYKGDPDINFVHTMSLRLPESIDDIPEDKRNLLPMPLDEIFGDALKRFDVVILDHLEENGTLPPSYFQGLCDYTEAGGAVLNISGPEYAGIYSIAPPESENRTPLADMMPMSPSTSLINAPFKPKLTALGTRSRVTGTLDGAGSDTVDPTWGEWVRFIDATPSPSAQVLMQTPDGKPLLVVSEFGKGRVASLLSDSFPLWERGLDGGGPAGPLLRHLTHWAMKDPAFADDSLDVSAGKDRNLHIERHTISDGTPAPIQIKLPDGQSASTEFNLQSRSSPGVWDINYPFSAPGVYQLTTKDGKGNALTAFASIGIANPPELAHPVSTGELLQPVAAATGGGVFRMAAGTDQVQLPEIHEIKRSEWTGKAAPGQIDLVRGGARVLKGLDRQSLPRWAWFGLIAGSLVWGYSGRGTFARPRAVSGVQPQSLKRG